MFGQGLGIVLFLSAAARKAGHETAGEFIILLSGAAATWSLACVQRAASLRAATALEAIMKFSRRQFLHLATSIALIPAASRIASAQTYPIRPVRIIVGFPAGGGNDIIARLM